MVVFRLRRDAFHGRISGTPASSLCRSAGRPPGPSLRSTAVGGGEGQVVVLPDLGRLRLADTVFLTCEGTRTIGLLFARDRSARTCLLTLDLRPTDGALAWCATVARITREGEHSPDGLGASFLFYPRQKREIAE